MIARSVLGIAALAISATAAFAHAQLERAVPAVGGTVASHVSPRPTAKQ